jgi:hypothetical protein
MLISSCLGFSQTNFSQKSQNGSLNKLEIENFSKSGNFSALFSQKSFTWVVALELFFAKWPKIRSPEEKKTNINKLLLTLIYKHGIDSLVGNTRARNAQASLMVLMVMKNSVSSVP